MTYATLMFHLQAGQSNAPLLQVAGPFADRFGSHVIGIAACRPTLAVGGYGMVCGDVYADDRQRITAELGVAKEEFLDTLQGRGKSLEWRSSMTITTPADYLSRQARCADLILTGSVPADALDLSRDAGSGSLVMEAGRPLLVAPAQARPMRFDGALVAWNDTRECRRATADALPFLEQCTRVTVLEMDVVGELEVARTRIEDVVAWLGRHGVAATAEVLAAKGETGAQLLAAADRVDADVIVAGAYGHNRLREWVSGGVTRDFLLENSRGVMVSH